MKRVEMFLMIAAVLTLVMTASAIYARPDAPSGNTSTISPASVGVMTDTTALRQIAITYQGQEVGAVALNRLGDLMYQHKEFSSARELLMQTTSEYLGFPTLIAHADYWLGKIAFHYGRYTVAENYLSKYLSRGSSDAKSQWARYYLTRAEYRDGKSEYAEAVQTYFSEPDSAASPHDFNIRYDLIRYLVNRHKYSAALAAADTFLADYPTNSSAVKVRFQTAIIHELLRQSNVAVQIYSSIISNAASKQIAAHAQFELATDYQGQGDYKDAITQFEKIPVLYPQQTEYVDGTHYALAMIKYSESLAAPDSGKPGDEAFDALRNFVSNYPTNSHTPRALMALADLYKQRGDYQSADAAYQKVIHFDTLNVALNPKAMARSNDIRAFRGFVIEASITDGDVLMSKLDNNKAALSVFQGLLKTDRNDHEARLKEAMCYIKLGKKDSATTVLNSLVQAGGGESATASILLKSVTSPDSSGQATKEAK